MRGGCDTTTPCALEGYLRPRLLSNRGTRYQRDAAGGRWSTDVSPFSFPTCVRTASAAPQSHVCEEARMHVPKTAMGQLLRCIYIYICNEAPSPVGCNWWHMNIMCLTLLICPHIPQPCTALDGHLCGEVRLCVSQIATGDVC